MEEQKSMKSKIKYEVFDLIKTFVICLVIVFLITRYVFTPVKVDGKSMAPTLLDQEIGVMNIFAARFLEIKRSDIVVVDSKSNGDKWVKRVIGLPNETVSAKDNIIYINGEPLSEPYLDSEYVTNNSRNNIFTQDFEEVTLAEDEYFLMGDNRNESMDSRTVGPFKRNHIKGNGMLIIFPFENFGFK